MSDLISRHGAIDHLRSIIDATDTKDRYNEGFADGLEFCISHMATMPSVQPEQRWIPCSERLPVPYEDVWCCSDIGQVVGYCDATGVWVGRGELELIVTAWMPLPEPYKGAER